MRTHTQSEILRVSAQSALTQIRARRPTHTYARYSNTHTQARGVQHIYSRAVRTHIQTRAASNTYKGAWHSTHNIRARRAHTYTHTRCTTHTYVIGVTHIYTRVVSNIYIIAWREHTYDPRSYMCLRKARLQIYARRAHKHTYPRGVQ
jgi:hypothetical protein